MFFDCEGPNCNSQYYRTEIGWVNWVNDQAVSDVHVIMTSTPTGAGGREYQLDFIGRETMGEYVDVQRYQTLPTDTDREELDGLTHVLGLGLARFANAAGYRGLVSVQGPDPEASGVGQLVSQAEVDDPWNLWVFRINGNLNLDGEETRNTRRLNGGFSANRVTPTWKTFLNGNINYDRREFELSDGTDVYTTVDWGFNPARRLRARGPLVAGCAGAGRAYGACQPGVSVGGHPGDRVQCLPVRRGDTTGVHLLLQDRPGVP